MFIKVLNSSPKIVLTWLYIYVGVTFTGFRKFINEETWTQAVARQYTGKSDWYKGIQVVTNPIKIKDENDEYHWILGATSVKLDPEPEEEPGAEEEVNVQILNYADPDVPTMSDVAHGQPSQEAGEVFRMKYKDYLYMIQPGTGQQQMQPGMPL